MPAKKPTPGPQVPIKVLRQVHGLTLKDLADRMAEHGVTISEAGLSNIENGNKKPSDRTLAAMASALGVHPLDVWAGQLRAKSAAGSKAA